MSGSQMAETTLRHLLKAVDSYLSDPKLTDLHINGVGQGMAFLDRGRGMERVTLPYSFEDLEDIAIYAAAFTNQDIGPADPIVYTVLPDKHRIFIALPPATVDGTLSFSIRQPMEETPTPKQLIQWGVFSDPPTVLAENRKDSQALKERYRAGFRAPEQRCQFLEDAIAAGLNIVFCGKVGAGKTLVMRSFTHSIPSGWRIVTIEDTHELLKLPCDNVVHLLYSKGGQSASSHGAGELVEAALRMGMHGILMQELRDSSAGAYINILKSGHWGMTTCHADNPADAYTRIAGLVKEGDAGRHRDEADILEDLHRCIDVVAYCVKGSDGVRRVADILWEKGASE